MPTEVLVKSGTPVVWADSTDYSATGSGFTRTAQILLESLSSGAARQGDKVDLGATRPRSYSAIVGWESGSAPTAGTRVDYYWSASFSGTAGTGNEGGASGADGAYKASEEAEWVKQLTFMGSLVLTNDGAGTVQRRCINPNFIPPTRYGMPIVHNQSGQTADSDSTQMYVALVPNVDEIQ